jgi:hypothetical protein
MRKPAGAAWKNGGRASLSILEILLWRISFLPQAFAPPMAAFSVVKVEPFLITAAL